MHVQQHIVRSGRKTLSLRSYPNIGEGLRELKRRVRVELIGHNDWTVDTNYDTTYWITDHNGKILRIFSLVVSRKHNEPIPFGHLLKNGRDSGLIGSVNAERS